MLARWHHSFIFKFDKKYMIPVKNFTCQMRNHQSREYMCHDKLSVHEKWAEYQKKRRRFGADSPRGARLKQVSLTTWNHHMGGRWRVRMRTTEPPNPIVSATNVKNIEIPRLPRGNWAPLINGTLVIISDTEDKHLPQNHKIKKINK